MKAPVTSRLVIMLFLAFSLTLCATAALGVIREHQEEALPTPAASASLVSPAPPVIATPRTSTAQTIIPPQSPSPLPSISPTIHQRTRGNDDDE